MLDDDRTKRLRDWIAGCLSAPDLVVDGVEPLDGGSIQENWRVRCRVADGARAFVLRKDAPATIASSRPRWQEFALAQAAFRAGVLTPEPVGFCSDPQVVGAPFALMSWVEGVGLGPRIAKDGTLGGDRARLARELGHQLARIHAIRPPHVGLEFLGEAPAEPALAQIADLRVILDRLEAARPALEWGLRWSELNAPACPERTLVHRDFRTGNYLVDHAGLTAVLDWEFAGWGDPLQDVGWFCAECWRFGQTTLEAGGIAERGAFYDGYRAGGGVAIDEASVRFWETMAHLRWAVIALEQGHRHLSGSQPSLELALTGRRVPDLERTVLRATAPEEWTRSHA